MNSPLRPPFLLKPLMIVTDIGFIAYWVITLAQLLPASWLFRNYTDSLLVAWNWSFLPLDLVISATGLTSLWLLRRGRAEWISFALISLTATSISGLQAISFWVIAGDFNLGWWLPNLFLLLYPPYFIYRLVRPLAK